ncbi:hypothetical protein PCANC_13923 [Puccinia coronata f. sp. avenae]|uniref:Uncharacterized protein n=1 Tax=Puccinia coronata f. sp. avenae TaxID=200324 RepID=A0A2N5SUN3_9BASI|nr:hypothetical protein PCANC_13923 [Puccinia coronata f. sp. avenae]
MSGSKRTTSKAKMTDQQEMELKNKTAKAKIATEQTTRCIGKLEEQIGRIVSAINKVTTLPENLLPLPPVDMQANPILLPPLLQS